MARHSHWANTKRHKALVDASRGKVFTRHARLVEIAAREGNSGDPTLNSRLAMAVEAARADNVPKDNIDRAIKKGIGAGGGEAMSERVYEAYAPGGVALLITAFTDNVTRTVANVRHVVTKNGGKVAEPGSVAFQFERRGIIECEYSTMTKDDAELAAIDAGAADLETDTEGCTVYAEPAGLMDVRKKLQDAGLKIISAEIGYRPTATVDVADPEIAAAITKLIDALEEDEDVDTVYVNAAFPEEFA